MAMIALSDRFSGERVEAACTKLLTENRISYGALILELEK